MFHNNRNSNSSTKKSKFSKASSVNSPLTNELYDNFSSKKSNILKIKKYTDSNVNSNNTKNALNLHSYDSTDVINNLIVKPKNDQCNSIDFRISHFLILFLFKTQAIYIL